jgi:hypothetical protein
MNALLGNIWLTIQTQLATIADLKFIDLDTGQLEYKDLHQRPQVLLPCALFDFAKANYTDLSENYQEGELLLEVRIGINPYTQATNFFTDTQKENALSFFNIEQEVYLALQGWATQYFGPLTRVNLQTEKRNDKIRVRVMQFKFNYVDSTAVALTTNIGRPNLQLNLTGQETGVGSGY